MDIDYHSFRFLEKTWKIRNYHASPSESNKLIIIIIIIIIIKMWQYPQTRMSFKRKWKRS
jgi:hypothetical protein